MKVNNINYRTIIGSESKNSIQIIDQTELPHKFVLKEIKTLDEVIHSIQRMWVRGAPLIGVTAAYGFAIALKESQSDEFIAKVKEKLISARPTAVNLAWAIEAIAEYVKRVAPTKRYEEAWSYADKLAEDDIQTNQKIGLHGLDLLKTLKKDKLNILTHCNAGWLATVDYGTALSPIYHAAELGMDIHVWVSETRPRNQGSSLTAWELEQAGIKHTVITDNAAGYLMQKGEVDCVIVGADRISLDGQVVNKIGTYLKAVVAYENNIPFYVAAPKSTMDAKFISDNHPFEIEYRCGSEVSQITGKLMDGSMSTVSLTTSPVLNPAFDLTPSKYISNIICEDGVFNPSSLKELL
jgi:methylthioribose-1-phosphate isomerase